MLQDEARHEAPQHAREHARRVGHAQQQASIPRPNVLVVRVEPGLRESIKALRAHHAQHRPPRRVDAAELRKEKRRAHKAERLHDLADLCDRHSALHHAVCDVPANVCHDRHGDPRQHRQHAAVHQVQAEHLVVVRRHPRQQDERAPVVTEVAHDDGPHLLGGQQLLPGDGLAGLALWRRCRNVLCLRLSDAWVLCRSRPRTCLPRQEPKDAERAKPLENRRPAQRDDQLRRHRQPNDRTDEHSRVHERERP
mmetsp:Transcript_18029/g.53965  ORF Transcript_18029/g.53965 Transcript_18029/m.53965 type:complete len:252 (-) Transcript_18029:702-1457(-)